jgi:putative addiction module component (TIGR02574 family)
VPRLTREEIEQLSVAERVQLVEEIWESIGAMPEQLPLSETQRRELDRRLERHEREPARTVQWDEVRTKLQRGS